MTRSNTHSVQEYLTDAYIFLLLTGLIFAIPKEGYLTLTSVKWPVFLTISVCYSGGVVLLYLEELLVGRRRVSQLADAVKNSSWTQRFLVLYLLFTLISAALSPHYSAAWLGGSRKEGVLTIGLYIISCLLVSEFGRPKPWMVHLLALTVTVQAVICVFQLQGGNPLSLYPAGVDYFGANKDYSGAYLGTVGNVDFLGTYFCLALPILWVSLLRMKSRSRFAYLVPLLLGLYVVLRMWVLSCVMGLVIGFAISLPVVLPVDKKSRRRVALAFAAAAAASFFLIYMVDLGGPFHALHSLLHGEITQELDSGRVYIWREVLRRVPEHLLFGAGPDTLSLAGIEPFQRFDEQLGVMLQGGIDTAHCDYLNVLYHQGIFALAAYVLALASVLWSWVCSARERPSAAVLGAAVTAYVIQATFNISMFFTASLFWAALGLLDGSCRTYHQERKGIKK